MRRPNAMNSAEERSLNENVHLYPPRRDGLEGTARNYTLPFAGFRWTFGLAEGLIQNLRFEVATRLCPRTHQTRGSHRWEGRARPSDPCGGATGRQDRKSTRL